MSNNLQFVCPNCGSSQVHKSLGGKAEHAAAWGVTKVLKSTLMGDYGRLTGGLENHIIKDEVPFQHVCDYCHRTFHARKSQIEAGAYSMERSKADILMETYNKKLQAIKDKEVCEIKERAMGKLKYVAISVSILFLGIIICANCEHTMEGLWGMTVYTNSFVFSWFIIAIGIILTLITGISWINRYNEATELENMSIQNYAKNHSA